MREFFCVSGHAGFLKGCLLSAVLVSIIVSFVPVRYEANDDFGLIGHLSEQSGFEADPFHPTLSAGLSRLLPSLYRAQPEVPWLGLLIYSSAFLGASLMFGVLFRSAQGWSLLFALPLLCILLFHVFAFASFTSAALILELGILLCLMEWVVREECPVRKPGLYAGVLAFGFLIGFFLRWRMVLYGAAFGIPILFFVSKQQLRKALPVLVAVGFVMISDRALFHLMSSEEQKEYLEYNRLRSQFHDSARGGNHGDSTREALRKAGWSVEDYGFYKSWILYDDRLFNAQTLRTFIHENDPKRGDSPFLRVWKGLEKHFRMGKPYVLALLFSSLCIVVYRSESLLRLSKRHRLKILLTLTVIGAGLLYIMYSRFVPRVFVPLFAYFFGVCFLLSHWEKGLRSEEECRDDTMKRLAMVGSGELSDRLIYYFEDTGFGTVVGMFDDFETVGAVKNARPILGKTDEIPEVFKNGAFDAVAIAIGYNHRKFRKEVYENLKGHGIPIATFLHPSSHVEKSALLQEGSIVLVGCTIDMNARVGENVLLSSRCFVSHNVKIGSHTFCGPAVNLAGNTEIGECCFLGINTTSIDGVRIGMNVQTAAGSVVTEDVPDNMLIAGVPAVVKKTLSFDG